MTIPARLLSRLNRMLDRAGARLRKARPGSVLILVIALLVLMALIGTAFITTAQVERYSATQNTYNTEADLLVQGVLGMAQAPMVSKVQGSQGYRIASSATNTATTGLYYPYESPTKDTYLADRLPTPNGTVPVWAYITAPLNGTVFEAPYAVDAGTLQALSPLPVRYTVRTSVTPTSISVPQADGSLKLFPALNITDPNVNGGRPAIVLAADADGDGIADAGFIRLPIGQLEGATYYGAARIIDNAAAINASIALEANHDTATGYAVPGDLFPVNLDLGGLLMSGDTLALLNQYRFNNGAANNGESYNSSPVDDFQQPHAELAFNTPYEAFWTQLAGRLNDPGYNTTSAKYQAVPISEALALGYHFCLANPNGSPSPVLETYLPISTGSTGPTSDRIPPFAPSQTTPWFNQCFGYNPNGTANIPLRPLLVVRNPVSNFVPSYFNDQGIYSVAGSYNFGDRVQATDPITNSLRGFVCVVPNSAGAQPPIMNGSYNPAFWAAMPWTAHPTKISANTGTFGQLWTAYWSVMLDHADGNGLYPAGPGQINDGPAPDSQFRSPIRGPNPQGVTLTNEGVTQLRAALAAVNTIDMRDGDEDITSRTIFLPATVAGKSAMVQVNVFGSEKQPYFTEMMVDYDPKQNQLPSGITPPWVAVEMYNPHPTAIPLKGWKLCSLNRASMKLTEVGDLSTNMAAYAHPDGQTGPLIEAGERLVFQSSAGTNPPTMATTWATTKVNPITCTPSGAGSTLDTAVGNELVLLRPRRADGTYTFNNDPQNVFGEMTGAAVNYSDLIPLDSIDMAGITYTAAPPPASSPETRYRYARANLISKDNNSAAWHCVYPGPYSPTGFPPTASPPAIPFHTWGIVQVNATTSPDNGMFGQPKSKFTGTQPSLQNGGPYAGATYETRPLQINNRDSAGPNKVYTDGAGGSVAVDQTPITPGMSFPYGGFARDGDILQVPFIGAYKIVYNNSLVELNSVTIDSVQAQFLDPFTLPSAAPYQADVDTMTFGVPFHNEQIGHFCPMDSTNSTDFSDDPTAPNAAGWKYHFAKRLFDYVAAWSPQESFLPNVDPSTLGNFFAYSGDPTLHPPAPNPNSAKYPPAPSTPPPQAVPTAQGAMLNSNLSNQQFQGLQDTAAAEGRININTAGWKALSAVPFYTPAEFGASYAQLNAAIAQAIIQFRETTPTPGHVAPGPFRSIFDLMQVPSFKALNVTWTNSLPGEANDYYGDFSPFPPTMPARTGTIPETDPTDHVFGDVKTRFLLLERISNLITTRSDSFTAYVQVQGWQNVGTAIPILVATRRAATLLDRSQVVPVRNTKVTPNTVSNAPVGVTYIPND